jgi:hypothetical protein
MLYKTLVLELLQEHHALHERLHTRGMLLQTMERCASELKARHDHWKDELHPSQAGSDPHQMSSKALELALQDLRDALAAASSPNGGAVEKPLSLDTLMALPRRYTPPA